jgi:hypothetical protein
VVAAFELGIVVWPTENHCNRKGHPINGKTKDKAKGVVRDLNMRERGIDARQVRAWVEDYPLLSFAAVVATSYVLGHRGTIFRAQGWLGASPGNY